ncbi:MAG: 4Fe-4S dicluster domain-containing protein [Acidobacteriota bacterium]|nr:4Fe-4S dicluster domain-containing protein [Acidobacteriota bacterium]
MQLGFVIDHSRCIGCHACTVACKAENDVPLGSFRTWVKYTEEGRFPQVKRSFAVLRCNQCTDAPCVRICPVRALEKRPDGIVDVDPAACIGCKACMQACPYDALYLNDSTGTAEKCHFCAHRVEVGLAPACAVVCPTEAIIPGDFHDPGSAVSRMVKTNDLEARKLEAGTGPNVWYHEASESAIDPLETNAADGYLWANQLGGARLDADRFLATYESAVDKARARTTYDVEKPQHWGWKVSAYLFTKSLAAGIFMVLALLLPPLVPGPAPVPRATLGLSLAAFAFLMLTTVLLIADLKRPTRFLYIVLRPNISSWLTRGAYILIAYGAVLTVWIAMLIRPFGPEGLPLVALGGGVLLAVLSACYTGWLFSQSSGRVLWMQRGLWLHLIVQAFIAGAAFTLLLDPVIALPMTSIDLLRWCLVLALTVHLLYLVTEAHMNPAGRVEEYRRAVKLITRGPFARRRYLWGVIAGILVPAALLVTDLPGLWLVAAVLALSGLYIEEDTLVRAGQALPIS